MRRACWWANLLLAGCAVLALLQSTGTVSGAGTGVRVLYLRTNGILDYDKACEVNPRWCDSEELGRFVAGQHISGEMLLAMIALVVAVLNLSGAARHAAPRLE
jgi:hypothetical protein